MWQSLVGGLFIEAPVWSVEVVEVLPLLESVVEELDVDVADAAIEEVPVEGALELGAVAVWITSTLDGSFSSR